MRKPMIFLLMIILSVLISGCMPKSYDDLYNDYQTYVLDQQQIYDDYIAEINQISDVVLPAVVMIKADFLSMGFQNIGTGAVIDEDDDYYYILSNNHVVTMYGNTAENYTVVTYLHETIHAELMFSMATYDLSLLKVDKSHELNVLSLDFDVIGRTDKLASIGYPDSQNNAITMGFFIEYKQITVDDPASSVNLVTFDVIVSNIPVKSGSSGSAMINEDFKLVGLVYAGRFQTSSDVSTLAYAVPSLKIIEFLEENEYWGLSS